MQAFVYTPGKPEALQILGELELDKDVLRHGRSFRGGPPESMPQV